MTSKRKSKKDKQAAREAKLQKQIKEYSKRIALIRQGKSPVGSAA